MSYNSKINLFIIKLKNDKWFLEYIIDEELNINNYFINRNYEFININAVEKIIEKKCLTNLFEIDKYVKEYMFKYGIDNVRGGSYKDTVLPNDKINSLKNEFDTINNIINNKSNCNNIINININYQNNRYVTPVKAHNGYVYFTGCCVCGKNCVGRGETPSCYNNIITKPPYKQNDRIKELMICCSCAKSIKGKELLDTNSELYKVSEVILKDNF